MQYTTDTLCVCVCTRLSVVIRYHIVMWTRILRFFFTFSVYVPSLFALVSVLQKVSSDSLYNRFLSFPHPLSFSVCYQYVGLGEDAVSDRLLGALALPPVFDLASLCSSRNPKL